MSGSYNVGMQGPGQAIVHNVSAPSGVDFTTLSTIVYSATFYFLGGTTLTLTSPAGWTISNVTATTLRATHIPTASEFPRAGKMTVRSSLTLDGVTYPMKTQPDEVNEEP